MDDNIIVKLIEAKMKSDGWRALTPDSYASYLHALDDGEIVEAVANRDTGD